MLDRDHRTELINLKKAQQKSESNGKNRFLADIGQISIIRVYKYLLINKNH